MSASELKKILIKKISKIEDSEFLNAIKTILESHQSSSSVYSLNDSQKKSVRKGKLQLASGKFKSNEKIFNEIEKYS